MASITHPSYLDQVHSSRRSDTQGVLSSFALAMERCYKQQHLPGVVGTQATPKGAQAGDGVMELDSTGAKRWDRDNSGVFGAGEACWGKSC